MPMTSEREVLALTPIADDPEIGRWLAALHHVIQHEAEHRAHIVWLRDTFPNR